MSQKKSSSALDEAPYFEFVKGLILDGATNTTIVLELDRKFKFVTSEKSVRRFRKRNDLQPLALEHAFTRIKGDEASCAEEPTTVRPILDDPDQMLRDRGLDPEDWYIDPITVNQWNGPVSGGGVVTYYQAKFTAKRKRPEQQLVAARSDGWVAPVRKSPDSTKPRLVVITGDQQAPFHDQQLHGRFLDWLEYNKPQEGVLIGDTVDFPDISRHRLDPENTATVNECIQSGYELLRGYVEASTDTHWRKLYGNHDERIRNLLLDNLAARPLYGVQRAQRSEDAERESVLDLDYLLRLDELGIEVDQPHGSYDQGQIVLSKYLAVRHGWLTKKGGGASALASLEHLGYNIVVGHTHRQGLVHKTTHDIYGTTKTLVGVEAGCMCSISNAVKHGRRFPSYAVSPDWQQGFATATIWPDGTFKIDLATFFDGVLLWRDQRFE